jgi:serine/threonine protein phosphatase PrpC
MEQSLQASNEALSNAIRDNGALKGMGCTLIAAYFSDEGLRWVSVGDSALLLYRKDTLRRLNADHSLGAMLNRQVEAGLIAPETAMNDPRRRALRSALTGDPIPLTDCEFNGYPLQASDWVILATDGLEVLSGDEIASIIERQQHQEPDTVVGSLMAAVEEKREQYQDNTTVIAMHVRTTSGPLKQPTKPADPATQEPELAKTVLIHPRGTSGTISDALPGSTHSSKETARRAWWTRMKQLLVLATILGAIAALALGRHTELAFLTGHMAESGGHE